MKSGPTVAQVLDGATRFLALSRPRSPRLDAEVLLAHVLGANRTQLYARALQAVAPLHREQFQHLVERRGQGVPVAYLVGQREFYGRRFLVTPDVLVPRPETEVLVEEGLRCLDRSGLTRARILDCCTGSGCVAISLALQAPDSEVWASDVCFKALQVAQDNLGEHGLEGRLTLVQGDLFQALPPRCQPFDLIVSNPPYVATDCGPRPEEGVVRYEPNLALFAGRDGLDLLRRLIREAGTFLNPGGRLVLEMAPFQIEGMEALMQQQGFLHTKILPDLSGLPRVLSGRWEP